MKLDVARKLKTHVQARIKDALHEHVHQLANRPPTGVWTKNKPAVPLLSVGVGTGAAAGDYKVAVRISRHGNRMDLVRKVFAAYEPALVDVKYVGRIFPIGTSPIAIRSSGASVSHYLTGTGTIGCPVRDRRDGALSLLSNNHVIGFENDAVPGDDVIDPGKDDGGAVPANTIARFTRCVNLDFSGVPNTVDAALAALVPAVRLERPAAAGFTYDPSIPPAAAARTSVVKKVGRSTGLTTGTVSAIEVGGFFVDYQNGPALFDGQIEVHGAGGPFAAHGDSGALVVTERGAAVGLLFAVSEVGVAYVNPIGPVLQLLEADLA